jgi:hypothetical protein
MAFTSDPYTSTDLQYTIPEMWPGMIQEQLFADTVALSHFLDMSRFFTSGGDIANIPDFFTNSPSVQTQSTQGTEITSESVAQGNTQLAVNLHKYIAQVFGTKDRLQIGGMYDIAAAYTKQAAGILKDAIEDSLFALWSGLTTNTSGDTATVLTDLEIRTAIEKVEARNANSQDGFKWFFHPYVFWEQVAGISKYYDASQWGAPSLVKTGGMGAATMSDKGSLYGIPVGVTTNVVGALMTYRNLLAHKGAFCYALQGMGANRVKVGYEYHQRNLADLLTVEVIYGVKELRDELACVVNARTVATTS